MSNQPQTQEHRYFVSTMKISLNALVVFVVAIILVLFNFFVIDEIGSGGTHDAVYWTKRVLAAIGTFMIMLGTANITEESVKRKNPAYNERLVSLGNFYNDINNDKATERIKFYILQKNIQAKYKAYIKKYKKKLLHAKKEEQIKYIENKLLATPKEVWSSAERIHYHEITYSLLISEATEVNPKEDENDMHIHKGRLVATKFVSKMLVVAGFGMYAPEIISHFVNFTSESVLPLCIRIGTILWALYCGVCFGYTLVDRILVVLRRKINVFSEFYARKEDETLTDENRYLIVYESDGLIEELRDKYNRAEQHNQFIPMVMTQACAPPTNCAAESASTGDSALKETWADTFGNKKPVSPGNFIMKLAKNRIEKDIRGQNT